MNRLPCPLSASMGAGAWLWFGAVAVIADLRRHRMIFTLFAIVWALALVRIFIHHTPVLPILFNWTPSLPYRVVLVEHGTSALVRGEYVVYAFEGEAAARDYPGLMRQPFFKRIAGVEGDKVTLRGRDVFVNGVHVGQAKTHTFDRKPLEPIAPTDIPPGQLYVQGSGPDSFDSRYRSSGLVRVVDVIAKVRPLF